VVPAAHRRGHDPGEGGDPDLHLASDADRSTLEATPTGEHLGEMDIATFEYMLAQHLTDDALERIRSMREERR
jgi:hypothetical protein